jgi:ATP-dependent DNA ligase I
LLQKPLNERRELLREHFQIVPGEFDFAKSSDAESTEEIQIFLEESVKDGCEGLMVKMLESDASYYEPSRRSVNWLKVYFCSTITNVRILTILLQLKKDYLAGVGDSLDLVVVGGYYGKGKRTNVYGAFLLACYDSEAEEFQTICKIGTGFSEEVLQTHFDALNPLELSKVRGDVKVGGAKPDVWFEPKIVWEVLTADLSMSPIYTAAQGLVSFGHYSKVKLRGIEHRIRRLKKEGYLCDSLVSFGSETTRGRMTLQGQSRRVLPNTDLSWVTDKHHRSRRCMSVKCWPKARVAKKRRVPMLTTNFGDCTQRLYLLVSRLVFVNQKLSFDPALEVTRPVAHLPATLFASSRAASTALVTSPLTSLAPLSLVIPYFFSRPP